MSNNFVAVRQSVSRNGDLSPSEKAVWLALASYADSSGTAFPSQARIAEDAGLSVRQVRRCLQALQAAGLVRWRNNPKRVGKHWIYDLNPTAPPAVEDVPEPPAERPSMSGSNRPSVSHSKEVDPLEVDPSTPPSLSDAQPSSVVSELAVQTTTFAISPEQRDELLSLLAGGHANIPLPATFKPVELWEPEFRRRFPMLDFEGIVNDFINHHRSSGTRCQNWDAKFNGFVSHRHRQWQDRQGEKPDAGYDSMGNPLDPAKRAALEKRDAAKPGDPQYFNLSLYSEHVAQAQAEGRELPNQNDPIYTSSTPVGEEIIQEEGTA